MKCLFKPSARTLAGILSTVWLASTCAAQTHTAWVQRYGGPGTFYNATPIAVDGNGDAYVSRNNSVGEVGQQGGTTLVKYKSSGRMAWRTTFTDSTAPLFLTWDLDANKDGSVVSCGGFAGGYDSLFGLFVARFDSSGTQQWALKYDGPAGSRGAGGWRVAYDGFGGIYAVGVTIRENNHDCLVLRLDTTGALLWTRMYDGPGHSFDQPTDLVVGSDGSIYISLISRGLTSLDYCLLKYSPSGDLEYETRYDGPSGSADQPSRVALDDSGNAYMTGGSGSNFATLKIDPHGRMLWVQRHFHPGNTFGDATGLGLSQDGDIYVTGNSGGNGKDYDILILCYSPEGTQRWEYRYDSRPDQSDVPWDLVALPQGGCIVVGESYGADGYSAVGLHMDAEGRLLWADDYTGPPNGRTCFFAVAFSPPNFAYSSGISGNDNVVLRYDIGGASVPRQFALGQNYPNPFDGGTTIPYNLISEGNISLSIFNILGQELVRESLGRQGSGNHQYHWNGFNDQGRFVPSGVYLVRLRMNGDEEGGKMVLLK